MKKIIKKHFNENLVMSAEDEERCQSSNKCCIVAIKLYAAGDNKVRDHNHVTGKCRVAAHWSCEINLKLT